MDDLIFRTLAKIVPVYVWMGRRGRGGQGRAEEWNC